MRNPGDILDWLNTALKTHSVTHDYSVIKDAIEEIERLRAGQFRWNKIDPKAESCPGGWVFFARNDRTVGAAPYTGMPRDADYWAPIPPLPERTQEEKDKQLWRDWAGSPEREGLIQNARDAFLAGLKAARGEK